ncbi:MAG: micrococcal nuclease [Cocleimonas sp.]
MISLTIVTVKNNHIAILLLNSYFKKALFKSAFFVLVFIGHSSIVNASSCQLVQQSKVEKATVKWVYDGDTLLVTDANGNNKRKIRIIGIDTPEVKHHQQKAQQYGAKAREELRVLLKDANYQIFLEFDKEKYDRYKRQLAHVTLTDGTNISEWLLQRGFAKTLIIPPNVKYANCYKASERQAQQQKIRLWELKTNRIKTIDELKSKTKGYVRLKGKVTKFKKQKKTIVFEFESKNKKPIQIRIKKKNLRYFKGLDPDKLVDQEMIVSGILKSKKGKRTITLSHSSQLERLSAIKTNNLKSNVNKHISSTVKWSTK